MLSGAGLQPVHQTVRVAEGMPVTMRSDLRGSWNAVRWADAHIQVLQERFVSWQRGAPYELVMERDLHDADWEFLVAYLRQPLDPLIVGDIGAIINSVRTGLDLLMSALLVGNGEIPNSKAHFPIRKSPADFQTAVDALEMKHWINAAEAAAIKRTKAYLGGDHFLYPLHQLDIVRKHERLLLVAPSIQAAQITVLGGASYAMHKAFDDKTILYRLPARQFRPNAGNTVVAAEIFFNEPTLLQTKQPATGVLRNFVARVRALIEGMP